MGNEVAKSNNAGNPKSLMQAQTDYVGAIGRGLKAIIGEIDSYQSVCGYNILMAINVALAKEGLNFTSPGVDKETINNAIKYVIFYRLNTDNREVFVIVRNENRAKKNESPKWVKVIEVKPQYRGVLKILADYGRDVERVYPEWIVREKDPFKYAYHKGIETIPPEWEQKDVDGKIVRVVVPIKYKDGTVDYRIAERESVATNIKAQIKQSVMYDKDKEVILAKIQDMTLDQLLEDKTLAKYINETYTGISKEEMLITKMVLNATKRVQIDYSRCGGQLARELNEKTFDNADVYKKQHTAEETLSLAGAPMIDDVKEIEAAPTEEEPKQDAQTKPEEPLNAQYLKAEEMAKKKIDEDGVVQKKPTDDDFYSLFDDNDNQ